MPCSSSACATTKHHDRCVPKLKPRIDPRLPEFASKLFILSKYGDLRLPYDDGIENPTLSNALRAYDEDVRK